MATPDLIGNIDQSIQTLSTSSSGRSFSPRNPCRSQRLSYTSLRYTPLLSIPVMSSNSINRRSRNSCYSCQMRNDPKREHKLLDDSFEDIYHISNAVTCDEINLSCDCHHRQARRSVHKRMFAHFEQRNERQPRSAPQITFKQ
jgi:hypothetical protein